MLWLLSSLKCSFKAGTLPNEKDSIMPINGSIIIVGFGSQAKAWALNLRDSKCKVIIALRSKSPSIEKARALNFDCIELESSDLKKYSFFLMLLPDDQHLEFFEKNQSFFKPNSHFVYAHGFSMAKNRLHENFPQFAHSLLAPKSIASDVRFQYETKGKIGAVTYAKNPELQQQIVELAKFLGFNALFNASVEEECTADLFSEQSLLCSLIPYGALKSYNLLRRKGISEEVAFMECFLELKSISHALVSMGPLEFFKLISPNALIGSQKGKQLLMGSHFDNALEQIFIDIENKQFYKEVEIDAVQLRQDVLNQWSKEELCLTFEKLKGKLIV